MSDEDSVELTDEQAKKVKGSPKTLMKLCKKLESQEWDLRKAEKYYDKVEDEVADTREKIRALSIKFGMGNVIYEENDVTLDDFKVKGNRRTLRNLIKKLQKQDKQLKKADEAVIKVEDEIKKTQKKIKVLSQKFGLQGAQEHSSSGSRYYGDDEEDDLESVGEQLGDAFKAAGDEIAYLAPIVARVVGKNIDDAHKAIQREIFPVDTGDED
jgi:septal ring factor EnvC (AmiA/AmiB activator)